MGFKINNLFAWFRNTTRKRRFSYDSNAIHFEFSDFQLYDEFYTNRDFKKLKKPISFLDKISFKSSLKDIDRVFGRPSTVAMLNGNPKIEVYLYKRIRNNFKQKFLFHVFKNKLVLISKQLPYAPDDYILKLQNKYLKSFGLPEINSKEDKLSFKDSEGNLLYLLKRIQYEEHYVLADEEFKSFVQQQVESLASNPN